MLLKDFLHTTPKICTLLDLGGIQSPKDFLSYFPKSYEDRRSLQTAQTAVADGKTIQSIKGYMLTKKEFG